MSITNARSATQGAARTESLAYEIFINDPPRQGDAPRLPNGEPKGGSPVASTLIYGRRDAVLTDPGFLADCAQVLGDWVASHGRNLTDIVITHGHGDHWFAAQMLAERFRARIVASAGTIAQMQVGGWQRGRCCGTRSIRAFRRRRSPRCRSRATASCSRATSS